MEETKKAPEGELDLQAILKQAESKTDFPEVPLDEFTPPTDEEWKVACEALLKGAFRPHHAECGYSWIEGESAAERIVAAYADDVCVRAGAADRPVFLVNATGGPGMLVELAAPCRVEFFDVFGKPAGKTSSGAGIVRLAVPASGYAKVSW